MGSIPTPQPTGDIEKDFKTFQNWYEERHKENMIKLISIILVLFISTFILILF